MQIQSKKNQTQLGQIQTFKIVNQDNEIYQDQNQQLNLINQNQTNKFNIKTFLILILLSIIVISVLVCLFFKQNKTTDQLFQQVKQKQINQVQEIKQQKNQIYDTKQHYTLITLNTKSALCLDGTPSSYYISKAGNSSNILIYFQGGAWCGSSTQQSTLNNCYQRSKTKFGSTKYRPQQFIQQYGYLSRSPKNYFKDWKKIIINYCDGTGYQGSKKQPVTYNDSLLYFRGYNITVQIFQHLQQTLGIYTKANKVVLTGVSAGGLAVFTWANYLDNKVINGKLWVISDSGIFYDTKNLNTKTNYFQQNFKNLLKFSNEQINTPIPQCIQQYKNQTYKCMFAQYIYKYIKPPMFVVQSLYDAWALQNIVGFNCFNKGTQVCNNTQKQIMQQNRKNVTDILLNIIKMNKNNGVFGFGCPRHGLLLYGHFSQDYMSIPLYSDNSGIKSIQNWIQNKSQNNIHIDIYQWPDERMCI